MQDTATKDSPASGVMRVLFGPHPKRTLIRVVAIVGTSFVVFKFVLLPIRVSGISMFPAYKDGQVRIVNRLSYARSEPQRGDVVAVRTKDGKAVLLKRVIGLPGELVAIRLGQVFINGEPLDETSYLKAFQPWQEDPRVLGEGEYLVIGDNRAMSQADHQHDVFHRTHILGKLIF